MKYSKFKFVDYFIVIKNTVLFSFLFIYSLQAQIEKVPYNPVKTGAEQISEYLKTLEGKSIGVVANQTSIIKNNSGGHTHLVDSLLNLNVSIQKVYAPEHGFRGKADAGEYVGDDVDTKTGLPLISLYGKHKKPTPSDMEGIDLMLFDIQDVGVRFYTYISTLHYVMEACAELGIPLLVLDRPNPNRHYVDGPVLETEHQSFIGMHPVPVVYGLTIGEYARLINGEHWLPNGIQCQLDIVVLKDYDDSLLYELPVKPSPNLPNSTSINLYPSLCFFEGTNVNAGRGTDFQFQVFGSPFLDHELYNFKYIPKANTASKFPKNKDKLCYGKDLRKHELLNGIDLSWLIDTYQHTQNRSEFFIPFFTSLSGTKNLQQKIEKGYSIEEIKASWQAGLKDFEQLRQKYVLY